MDTITEHKKKYPKVNYADSVESILKDPEIKAVLIATPASTHYALIKQFLLRGKDVFTEKPLALKVEEGEELVSLAKQKKRILMVGHILQYHPAMLKLKEMISGGELGKIRYVYSNRLNIGKLRTEENILWSFAPHDISVILMLLDEDPICVSASGGDYVNTGINDVTLTSLEFADGVKGHVFVSWLHPFKEQKLIVVGSKAMAVFDDMSKEKLFLYPHKIEWKNGKIPEAQKADFQAIGIGKGEPLRLEIEHFVNCINTRKTPKTDGLEGLKVLRILEKVEDSLLEKRDLVVNAKAFNGNVYVHKTACIDEDVILGEGTKIWHFSHILKDSIMGKNCIVGQNVCIGPGVTVGNRCKIQNNVSLYKGVMLEDDVFCGPSAVFTNVYNPRSFIERKNEFRKTLVKKGATIGANATIVCGITIGEYAFIGAGAVVKKDVPDHALVVGVPARQIGYVCKCGTTLVLKNGRLMCDCCGNEYMKYGNDIKATKHEEHCGKV
jgi:UDP-2-acetamido-3-amino-2,3-dideoxy-glucuronate N-acetyltransferase